MMIRTAFAIVPLSFLLLTACPGPSARKDEVVKPDDPKIPVDVMANKSDDSKVMQASSGGRSSSGNDK